MRKEAEQKAIAVLRGHPCFAAAGEEELARLVRHESTVLREMEKGQIVFPPHGAGNRRKSMWRRARARRCSFPKQRWRN